MGAQCDSGEGVIEQIGLDGLEAAGHGALQQRFTFGSLRCDIHWQDTCRCRHRRVCTELNHHLGSCGT